MESVYKQAAEYLKKHDPVLAPIITSAGLCTIKPNRDYYGKLVDSIIGQQLSVKAAESIQTRFLKLFNNKYPSPDQILATDIDVLRSAGLSRSKAQYIKSLAEHIVTGQLELEKFSDMSNDEIIEELTAVKGIGEWTAHMFLMFAMARPNILPVGDLGIRNSIKKLYGFDYLPTPADIHHIAEKYHWHPYESIASWYIWQSLDNTPSLT